LQSGSTSTVTFVATPSAAGSYSATATVFNSNDTNTSNTATASFTATDFSVSVSPTNAIVAAGSTAPYTVTVFPSSVFGSNVSLSCSALPTGAACGFSPSTLTFSSSSPQSSALNLTTTARPVTTASNMGSLKWTGLALWLGVPGIALLGFGTGKSKRNRLLGLLLVTTLFGLVMLQPACSSSRTQQTVSGTPAGTYFLTVTATSGSFSKSAPFTLQVQ
jgi:hypothetical protein